MSLQNLKKEVKDEVDFLHADKHQSFYKLGLLFLIEVASYVQSTKNRKLVIFLQYIKKRVLQLLLCSIVMQNIPIFYWGPVMFIATCFLAQPDCRNFLPEHSNTIIKQQLCGKKLLSLLPLFQVDLFQEKQGILITCITPCDTNNSTENLTRMYHHTATERLYRLRGAKIS